MQVVQKCMQAYERKHYETLTKYAISAQGLWTGIVMYKHSPTGSVAVMSLTHVISPAIVHYTDYRCSVATVAVELPSGGTRLSPVD